MRQWASRNARTAIVGVCAALAASVATAGAAGLITGKQIKNGSITSADLSPALRSKLAQTGAAGAAGPQGAAGPAGAKGEPGAAGDRGPAGATNVVERWGTDREPASGVSMHSDAFCLAGERAVGGGYHFTSSFPVNDNWSVMENEAGVPPPPFPDLLTGVGDGEQPSGWYAVLRNNTGQTFGFRAFALCAKP